MPELVYNVKFNIEQPSGGTGGVTKVSEQVEVLENKIKGASEESIKLGTTIDQASKKGSKGVQTLTNNMNQVTGSAKRMNTSFSSTNQLLFSFGDGIQDASQFSYGFATGMRAVGNNIGFTAELFANLKGRINEYNTANQAAIATGKLQAKTMKSELAGSIMGPGGALLAINLAITAVTMFTRAQEVNKKKIEEAKGSIDNYAKALRSLAEIAEPTKTIREDFERQERDLPIAIDLAKQLEKAQKNVVETQKEINAAQAESVSQSTGRIQPARKSNIAQLKQEKDESERLVESLKDQIAQYTDLGIELPKLEGALKEAQKMMGVFRGEIKATTQIELGVLVDTLRGDVSNSLMLYELGIKDAIPAIDGNLGALNKLIDLYTAEANTGNTLVIPTLKELVNLRKQLTEQVSPDLGISAKEFIESLDITAFESEGRGIFGELGFISDMGFEMADELNKSFNEKSEQFQEESLDKRIEQYKQYYKEVIEQAKIAQKSEELILQFTTRASATARDTIEGINAYYNNKEIQERKRLVNQKITDERVFAALSLAIEGERQEALKKLAEDGSKARRSIQEQEQQQMLDLYMRLVSNVSGAAQALFGENKSIAIAETIINTYFAAQKAAASAASLGPIASKIAAAAEIAAGIARVAKIQQTNIGSSSISSESSSGSFGFQMTNVQGAQTFRTPSFTPTSGDRRSATKVDVQIMADRKQLYAIVKRGEEEYRQIKV